MNSNNSNSNAQQPTSRLQSKVLLARTILYGAFLLFALLTFILGAALIGKTSMDFGFYYEASAELLVAGILAVAIVTPLHFLFHRRPSTHVLSTTWVELVVLVVLNLLFLGGAAAMAHQLSGLSYCTGFSICDLANALQAFSWLSWITSLLLITLIVAAALSEKRPEIWREQFTVGRAPGTVKETPGTTKEVPVQMSEQEARV